MLWSQVAWLDELASRVVLAADSQSHLVLEVEMPFPLEAEPYQNKMIQPVIHRSGRESRWPTFPVYIVTIA